MMIIEKWRCVLSRLITFSFFIEIHVLYMLLQDEWIELMQ